VFLKVFWLTLFPDRSPTPDFAGFHRTSPNFPGLLLAFVEIMPDKVILYYKFFTYGQFLIKIGKNENVGRGSKYHKSSSKK